jgi:hypothetical protein
MGWFAYFRSTFNCHFSGYMTCSNFIFLLLSLCCCSNKTTVSPSVDFNAFELNIIPNYSTDTLPSTYDTIKRMVVDDYPLSDDMFEHGTGLETRSGDVYSFDKMWYINHFLKQTLVVELYTDNFRMIEYHFKNDDVPKAIIERMELHTKDGELASQEMKQRAFKGLIAKARNISTKYFTTEKGFRLGDSKHKATNIYGAAHKRSIENGVEILEWHFVGDILYDGKTRLNGKPLAKDSYGHLLTMMFRNNRLIAIIFYNEIP